MVFSGDGTRYLVNSVSRVGALDDMRCILRKAVEGTSSTFVLSSPVPSILTSELTVVV